MKGRKGWKNRSQSLSALVSWQKLKIYQNGNNSLMSKKRMEKQISESQCFGKLAKTEDLSKRK